MIIIYGIKNCDSCKKAAKYFSDRAEFWDVRDFPLPSSVLEQFVSNFGSGLINTRSKTWRTLSEADKILDYIVLIKKFPTVMKRPVIDFSGTFLIGWSDEIKKSIN